MRYNNDMHIADILLPATCSVAWRKVMAVQRLDDREYIAENGLLYQRPMEGAREIFVLPNNEKEWLEFLQRNAIVPEKCLAQEGIRLDVLPKGRWKRSEEHT